MLIVRDVWKAYKKEQVLQGVSLSAMPGEVLGICGANGAGKTTLLNMIASVLDLDQGEISLFGTSVRKARSYRQHLGYVPQNIALSPRLTVRQNLQFWASLCGLSSSQREDAVREAARLGQVETFLHKPVGRCSGGMARRANLAAGLVGRPKMVLLDEPTAGIDRENRDAILGSIEILRERGCIVLMVNHYYEELERICDRIVTLQNGIIAEEGAYAL